MSLMTMLYMNFNPDRDKMSQVASHVATYCKVCYVGSEKNSSSNDSLTSKKEASSS